MVLIFYTRRLANSLFQISDTFGDDSPSHQIFYSEHNFALFCFPLENFFGVFICLFVLEREREREQSLSLDMLRFELKTQNDNTISQVDSHWPKLLHFLIRRNTLGLFVLLGS